MLSNMFIFILFTNLQHTYLNHVKRVRTTDQGHSTCQPLLEWCSSHGENMALKETLMEPGGRVPGWPSGS